MPYLLGHIYQYILAAAFLAFLILLSHALGTKLISAMRLNIPERLDHFLIAQGLGLAVISYSVFVLGIFGGLSRLCIISIYVLAAPILLHRAIANSCSGLYKVISAIAPFAWFRRSPLSSKIALLLLTMLLAANILGAMTPPVAKDALKYHLEMPRHYLESGYVRPDPVNIYSYFPGLVEMLYTLCLALSNYFSCHLIHLYFGILSALAVIACVRRVSDWRAAIICGALFYSTPLVSELSGWAYVDLALSFYTILAAAYFSLAIDKKDCVYWKLSALMLGISLGIKYLALVSVISLIAVTMAGWINSSPQTRPRLLRRAFTIFSWSGIIGLPWYIRNVALTGNPLFPFFYALFGGPGWDIERASMYQVFLRDTFGMGRGLSDLLLLPGRLIINGSERAPFEGIIGPSYLLLAPILLLFVRPKKPATAYLLIYSACFFIVWALMSQQARFILPALGILSICFYPLFDRGHGDRAIRGTIAILLALSLITINAAIAVDGFRGHMVLHFVSGRINREGFLSQRLKNYKFIQYINANLPDTSKIYMIFIGNLGFYCDRSFLHESVFEDYTLKKILQASDTPESIAGALKDIGITHILIDEDIASRYLYPDMDQRHMNNFERFRGKYLTAVYSSKDVFLYRIGGQSLTSLRPPEAHVKETLR